MPESLLVRRVKYYSRDLLDMLCIIGSFVTGRATFRQTKAFIYESIRYKLASRATKKGKNLVTHFNGKRLRNTEEVNKLISDAIISGKPYMVARYGTNELDITCRLQEHGKKFVLPVKNIRHALNYNAGFFPDDTEQVIKFVELMRRDTSEVDLISVSASPMYEYILRTYGNENLEYADFATLEPFFTPEPWTWALEGKRVLVIHPYYKTIPAQYEKRELLRGGGDINNIILPKFQLIMQRAVQTIAGNKDPRFNTWFDALDYMYNEAMTKDFDVAIIGCGAYGFPLAARIKRAGKIAIHLGGATQLLFGIKGKRWENAQGYYKKLLDNPNWVRPSEKPERFETIENSAYW